MRFPKGDPDNPLSWQELIDKYRALVGSVWGSAQAERVEDAVRELEHETTMQAFAGLLSTE